MTKDDLTTRIRRAHPAPVGMPSPDDPSAIRLRDAILAETPDPATSMASVPRRVRRISAPVVGLAALAIAATAVAGVAIVRFERPPQPLGADAPVSLLAALEQPSGETIPADRRRMVERTMDLSRTRMVLEHEGIQVFVGLEHPDSFTGPNSVHAPDWMAQVSDPRVCLLAVRRDAAGSHRDAYGVSVCGYAWVGTGDLAVTLQTRVGGVDVQLVRFGIVPDDFVSVALAGGGPAVPVRDNVYALPLEHASTTPALTFTRADGSTVDIGVPTAHDPE